MITYYPAFVLLLEPDFPPEILEGYKGKEACTVEADKQNRNSPLVRDKTVRELGGEFVCPKVERSYV
jgi:hypothetical protein